MTTLKSIALELLQKYEKSETSLIWEYSGDIDKSEEHLDAEVAKYRELIDKYAEQEPCDDVVSRQAVIDVIDEEWLCGEDYDFRPLVESIEQLPSVKPQEPNTWHCKNCKYFECDSVAKVDGVPLIVAHEICNKWGDGCKTKEDGYCFLFKPQESEDKE